MIRSNEINAPGGRATLLASESSTPLHTDPDIPLVLYRIEGGGVHRHGVLRVVTQVHLVMYPVPELRFLGRLPPAPYNPREDKDRGELP